MPPKMKFESPLFHPNSKLIAIPNALRTIRYMIHTCRFED